MKYQEIYNGLNKKASNEQIKKLASIIGMVKRAAEGGLEGIRDPRQAGTNPEDKIPMSYIVERDVASRYSPQKEKLKLPQMGESRAHELQAEPPAYLLDQSKIKDLPKLRNIQSQKLLQWLDILGKGPKAGSGDYGKLRDFLIRRGQQNWKNHIMPTIPVPPPKAPALEGKYDVDWEDLGRQMVSNRRASGKIYS